MPRKYVSAVHDKVVRLRIAKPLVTMVDDEAAMKGVERNEFLRDLLRHQAGLSVVTRPPASKNRREMSGRNHPTVDVNLYLSTDLHASFQQLANKCGNSKTGLISTLMCDYFDVLPLKLKNRSAGS